MRLTILTSLLIMQGQISFALFAGLSAYWLTKALAESCYQNS